MIQLRERGLQLIRDIPEDIKVIYVYGDQVRIQQVLADFLLNMVRCAPGWVELQVKLNLKQNTDGTELALLQFRSAIAILLFDRVIYINSSVLVIFLLAIDEV